MRLAFKPTAHIHAALHPEETEDQGALTEPLLLWSTNITALEILFYLFPRFKNGSVILNVHAWEDFVAIYLVCRNFKARNKNP